MHRGDSSRGLLRGPQLCTVPGQASLSVAARAASHFSRNRSLLRMASAFIDSSTPCNHEAGRREPRAVKGGWRSAAGGRRQQAAGVPSQEALAGPCCTRAPRSHLQQCPQRHVRGLRRCPAWARCAFLTIGRSTREQSGGGPGSCELGLRRSRSGGNVRIVSHAPPTHLVVSPAGRCREMFSCTHATGNTLFLGWIERETTHHQCRTTVNRRRRSQT